MAHPIGTEHRAHHHERHRVHHIAGVHEEIRGHHQRARGGKVTHGDEAEDRELIRKEVKGSALKHEGKKPKYRADKAMRRARGGKVHKGKGHGKTNVNVIVAPGHSGAPMPMGAAAAPAAAAPPMPPRLPMPTPAAPAGAPPGAMGAIPGLGGGMPPRKAGGRAYKKGGRVPHDKHDTERHYKSEKIETRRHHHHHGSSELHGAKRNMGGKVHDDWGAADMAAAKNTTHGDLWGDSEMKGYAKGGKVEGKKSTADKRGLTGIGERTPIQHSGNKSDTQNIGRGPVITRANGGPIYADGREGHDMGPNLHAGANSGVGRRAKNHLARAGHWEA